jgi:probable metal-binding protein
MSIDISSESIHGHEVIHLILDARPALTRQTLAEQVRLRFGDEPRFHTCSAGGLTLTQLLSFLAERGKLVETPDGQLGVATGNACSHGDE